MTDSESQNELESLIEMAESVSMTVEDLHTKITNLRSMAVMSLVTTYAGGAGAVFLLKSSEFSESLNSSALLLVGLIGFTLASASIFFLFQYVSKIKKLKYKIETEREVLHHLLDMVFEYKDHVYSGNHSFVEKALIEMRLKRIGFSSKW
jgi:hypothetical protein